MSITKTIRDSYNSTIGSIFGKRRFKIINDSLADFTHTTKPLRILEIGCGSGRDFAQFIPESNLIQYFGIDLNTNITFLSSFDNITRIKADARCIPFPDKSFDLVVSIGVLEHIEPIEDLCKVISEIRRVGKNYCVVVPAITTVLEPHTLCLLWQLRSKRHKSMYPRLNYFSDEAWGSFSGFKGCQINRFYLVPLLISDTMIYSPQNV